LCSEYVSSRGGRAADTSKVSSKTILALTLALGASALAFGAEGAATAAQPRGAGRVIESLPLHLVLSGMKKAQAPRVVEGELVLSVSGPYRSVAAAFAHEGFALLHPYERNRQGVFVLAYPVPLKRSEPLEYRVVIDGAWGVDPLAGESGLEPGSGVEVSVARVPYLSDLHLGLYKILGEDGKTARFIFRGASGESVTVCGDFDNWDPFILEMTETSSGVYELEMPLSPGRHYYNFIYRGEALTDPLNPEKASKREGGDVSVLTVAAAN
jgi:hypothetical protein